VYRDKIIILGEPWYVTGFEPNADAVVAHHIRIWTCEPGLFE